VVQRRQKDGEKILATLEPSKYPYGPAPWEMHHGGSLWVLTDAGWRMYLAQAAIEWSLQFCADPAKIDRLRQDAKLLVDAFPRTIPALEEFGYTDGKTILNDKITDVDGVARYTDSLFNSCVPLSRGHHQGVLPRAAGEHYYPIPIKDGDFIDTTTSSFGSRSRTAPTRPSPRWLHADQVTAVLSFSTLDTEPPLATLSPGQSKSTNR
jgi:hypothetical protein